VAYPPSRHRFARGLETVPIRHRRTCRGAIVCNSSNVARVAWGSAMAAHVVIDLIHVLFLVLPGILIATIPVSIAGWGVREGAMLLAFFLCRPDRERRFNHFHSFWRCEFGGAGNRKSVAGPLPY
jgi:hypothetical protein